MKSLRGALWSLVALSAVVAGCAPPVVGGVWRAPGLDANGWTVNSMTLEFIDGANVRIGFVDAGEQRCRARHSASTLRPWFVNGAGEIVISLDRCVLELPSCDNTGAPIPLSQGSADVCGGFFLPVLGSTFQADGARVVNARSSRVFTRD